MKIIKFLAVVLFTTTSLSVYAQSKGIKFDPNYKGYYLLKSQFRGDAEALEGNESKSKFLNGSAFMSTQQGNPTGQQWKFIPVPGKSNLYKLQTRQHGSTKCLEGNQINGTAKKGAAFMDNCQNVTGQQWTVENAGNGYYRLKTIFQGAEISLESNQIKGSKDGIAFMDKQQNVTGQLWYLVPVN